MRTHDLAKKLLDLHDMELVVDGYEGGVTSKIGMQLVQLDRNVNTEPYYGEHKVTRNPDNKRVKVVYLYR
jgi:hypothetical protein